MNFLTDLSVINNSQTITMTESHLSDQIKDCEINIPGFDVHRSDRCDRSNGGVVIYTKSEVKATQILEWNNEQCESVGIWSKVLKTLLICVYHPPNSGNNESFSQCLDTI